jgi:hypothetical protein
MTANTELRAPDWWQCEHGGSCGCIAQARADHRVSDAANPFPQAERLAKRQVSGVLALWLLAANEWNERMSTPMHGPVPCANTAGGRRR